MTSRDERHGITFRKVVYDLPGVDQVSVRRDVVYCEVDDLTMDMFDDSSASREIIRQMLAFMRFHLGLHRAEEWLRARFSFVPFVPFVFFVVEDVFVPFVVRIRT
jgi:hypothetical protein